MKEQSEAIKKHLSKLLLKGLDQHTPFYYLEQIRQKIEARNLQPLDKGDILSELGKIQEHHRKINSEMLAIHDLLKKLS